MKNIQFEIDTLLTRKWNAQTAKERSPHPEILDALIASYEAEIAALRKKIERLKEPR